MQNALTVIVKVKPDQLAALDQFLCEIGSDIRRNPHIPFARFTTTHFARWVLFDQSTPQPMLVFTSNHDGPWEAYIDLLVDLAGPAMDAIWGKCVGYPGGFDGNLIRFKASFRAYMKANMYPAAAFFVAYPAHTAAEVHSYTRLRMQIERLLDRPEVEPFVGVLSKVPLREIVPQPGIGHFIGSILTLPLRLILEVLAPLVLRLTASNTVPTNANTPSILVNVPSTLTERESIVQNELTVISDIIPGKARQLKFILWLIGELNTYFGNGTLSNIATIHFARWVVFDNDKRLFFESNYDGTWESYIGDFVDKAAAGMDAIWKNCIGYPPQGAHDIQAFKKVIRDHEYRAQIFFSAYPDQSVKNLRSDIIIGTAVQHTLSQPDVIEVLRRF